MPKTTFSLATGYEGEAGGKWWRLWVRDGEEEEVAYSGDSLPPQPDKGVCDRVEGGRVNRLHGLSYVYIQCLK